MNSRRTAIRILLVLSLTAAGLFVDSQAQAHWPGVVLTARGAATIDGALATGEWNQAASVDFLVNLPEGGTTPGTILVMNDDSNLYLAVFFARTRPDAGNTADFEFDNDHGGGDFVEGDDGILINPGIGFFDEVRAVAPPCPIGLCWFFDTSVGGSNDGGGVFHNDGIFSIYEFSHPLASGDAAHGLQLTPGDTVGFRLSLRLCSTTVCADTVFPSPLGSASSFGDIVIASAPSTTWFLRSAVASSPAFFLDPIEPRGIAVRTRDSAVLNFAGGNPFREIGSWTVLHLLEFMLSPEAALHAWVGMKNSDDVGTPFDLRAELYRNGILLSSGLKRCITGLDRSPDLAREVAVTLEPFPPEEFKSADALMLKVFARIGTNPEGTKCSGPGGSHASATGLRLYFDSASRPSKLVTH